MQCNNMLVLQNCCYFIDLRLYGKQESCFNGWSVHGCCGSYYIENGHRQHLLAWSDRQNFMDYCRHYSGDLWDYSYCKDGMTVQHKTYK